MSAETSQRTRKTQSYNGVQGTLQNASAREPSPSPSFRERQRALKGQSVPHVYVTQQPSPTTSNSSHQSKRSPPPSSRISPPQARDFIVPPPAPVHTNSQPDIRQGVPLSLAPPILPQHSLSQPDIHSQQYVQNPAINNPRPINRVPAPPFISQFHHMESNWQMTDELMAEIERADLQQAQAAGAMGVAYAGGASSGPILFGHLEGSPPKDYNLQRVRTIERASPKDSDGSQGTNGSLGRRQARDRERDMQALRDSPKGRERAATMPIPILGPPIAQARGRNRSPPDGNDSPQYQTPMASPGEHTASYTQYEREYYPPPAQSVPRVPSPPALRKSSNATAPDSGTLRVNPPAMAKLASQTPPAQAAKTRTPDRSLPVQEEPEEDVAVALSKMARDRDRERRATAPAGVDYSRRDAEPTNEGNRQRQGSPTPSSDLHPEGHEPQYEPQHDSGGRLSRAEHREEDSETLNEPDDDEHIQHLNNGRQDESEGFTPRSPTAELPSQYQDPRYTPNTIDYQQTIRSRNRNGIADQMGLRGLEQTFEILKEQAPAALSSRQINQNQGPYVQHQAPYNNDLQHFFDESSYLQAYLQSPRPNAPIPPTPHSQTAAPSPSPLISGIHTEFGPSPAPPVGSPYPYPFTHIRRTQAYDAAQANPASPTYDPNHPAAIQEQLARQMQIYALNNAAMMTDSTLSPSSTPYPGPGYNPWTFLPTTRTQMRMAGEASMSLRSSPSHEPLELVPPRPLRGRGLRRREESINLRVQGTIKSRKPPPRVESTQPRETSPESTSGEDTAGEEKVEEHFIVEEGQWVNGASRVDHGEWVDEDDEFDEDDLLELEFHPSYVSNSEKRRRKWDTRWEDLVQSFQALDRQTDSTLVLLASPPHSTKLHALTSRSLRRDPSLRNSPALSSIRSSFSKLAAQRRAARSKMVSLAERLSLHSGSSADGSDGSSSSREEDLKRALEAALGSLGALGHIYEQRESRWKEEMHRLSDDRERVELLLKQALGSGLPNGNSIGHAL